MAGSEQAQDPARQGHITPLQCMDCRPLTTFTGQSNLINQVVAAECTNYDPDYTANSKNMEPAVTNMQHPEVDQESFR